MILKCKCGYKWDYQPDPKRWKNKNLAPVKVTCPRHCGNKVDIPIGEK